MVLEGGVVLAVLVVVLLKAHVPRYRRTRRDRAELVDDASRQTVDVVVE